MITLIQYLGRSSSISDSTAIQMIRAYAALLEWTSCCDSFFHASISPTCHADRLNAGIMSSQTLILYTSWVQAVTLKPRPLGASAIQELLQAWSEEHAGLSLLPLIAAFADQVYSLTAGHAGLTGVCLDQLTSLAERQGQLTLTVWSRFAVLELPVTLHALETYRKIVKDVDQLDNTASNLLNEVGFLI